ncbi:hypothetical protein J5O04_00710 [Corynebacterium hindlerae]|uniref:hypothetical protein n=1 Tax=Corynebacterium hindlerae TaxID=699041 RepID=UPI001AD7E25C|nr:hypothetical protein [Corynebacterium hindlerae]QTH59704.1 hypothetical protein J5O04_00710 [Corynebacterium hindlerae]
MPSYRLKPRLQVWKITGLVAALLALPNLVNPVVPVLDDNRSQVKLGDSASDWEIPVEWPEGGPLTCKKDDESMFSAWTCDGATVSSFVFDNVVDQGNSLKRGIRAVSLSSPGPGRFATRGDVLLYETADAIGFAQQGTQDHEGKTLIVVVSGEQQVSYSELILNVLRGGEGKLPDISEIGAAA